MECDYTYDNEHSLTALQSRLLDMLSWYHEFCVNNGLRYYALGGTMLGAARHQGFIPWDDDIDVGMPRKDYEKFISLCRGKYFGNYVIESIDTEADDYFYGYTKVYDTSTTLIEHAKKPVVRGIYLDLFPLDGVGNSEDEAISRSKKIIRKYNVLLTRTCAQRKGRKLYKTVAIFLMQLLPDWVINNKKLMLNIDRQCRALSYDECSYIGNLYGNWGLREVMPRNYMGIPCLYSFENIKIYGAERYDDYLTCLYGNWRKLPPKERQVTHHDYMLCNLDQSYLK